MKKNFDRSLDAFLNRCSPSGFGWWVRYTLSNDKYIKWKFVSGSVCGDVYRVELVSQPTDGGLVFRLVSVDAPLFRRCHIEPVSVVGQS